MPSFRATIWIVAGIILSVVTVSIFAGCAAGGFAYEIAKCEFNRAGCNIH